MLIQYQDQTSQMVLFFLFLTMGCYFFLIGICVVSIIKCQGCCESSISYHLFVK